MLDKPSIRLRFLLGRFFIFAALAFMVGAVGILFFAKIEEKVYASGYVAARSREDVRALTSGVIASLLSRDGDHVRRGDVLATLDDAVVRRELDRQREKLARAEAEYQVTQRKFGKLQIDTLPESLRFVNMDRKHAELEMRLAESEWRTAAKLQKEGIVSQLELESRHTKYQLAANALAIAEQRVKLVSSGLPKAILDEARAGLEVARQSIEACRAECRRLEEETERHIIRASASGWVILDPKRPGESVQAGELMFRIQTSEKLELRVFVPEDCVLRVEEGQKVLIYSSLFGYQKYGLAEGHVRCIASSAEQKDGQAVYLVRVDVDSSPLPLRIGSTAEARILVQKRTILEMLLDSVS